MNFPIRPLVAVVVALSLAACKSDQVREQPQPEPQPEPTQPTTEPETARLDPADHTDVRNLENPESLLDKRLIYFDFDKSVIRSEFRDIISAHATYLSAHPGAQVTLEGHADERGTREYNLGLGERRGNSVRDALLAQGANARQIDVVSYGEERPVCRESDESCWWQNRRVEILYTATGE